MNTLVAAYTNHNASIELVLFIVTTKMHPSVHFLGYEMVKGELYPALAACAGFD